MQDMEMNGRKEKPVRLGTHGENYGNWMSAPVFYMVGALVVFMAVLCVISHFIPGMRLIGVLALIKKMQKKRSESTQAGTWPIW